MITKVCTNCKRELPMSIEYFRYAKNVKDGYTGKCKNCLRKYYEQYRYNNRDKIKEYRENTKDRMAEYQKQYAKHNKEKIKIQKQNYREKNKESIARKTKQYQENNKDSLKQYRIKYIEENKIKIRERCKKYREKNKHIIAIKVKKYTEKNKEKIAEYQSKYRKEHLENRNINEQKRKARKKVLPATLTIEQWEDIKLYFNNKCAYCGEEKQLSQDHFIPLSSGGEYTHNNILPACLSCNSSKNNKLFSKWYCKQEFYNEARETNIYKFLGYKNNTQQLKII